MRKLLTILYVVIAIEVFVITSSAVIGQFQHKPMLGVQVDGAHPLGDFVGAWFFLEGSGSTVSDLSGNGTICTLTNSPVWESGKYGSAITFDGDNDFALAVRQPPTCLSQITIIWSGYVYPDGVGDDWGRIIDWYPAPSLYRSSSNRINWYGEIGGVSRDYTIGNADFTGAQHICAVTFDGTNMKTYIDGILDNATTTYSGALSAPSNTFCIAGRSTGTDRCLAAKLDWVMIYNRALSASEIAELYREPFGMFVKDDIAILVTAAVPPPAPSGQVITIQMSMISVIFALVLIRRKLKGDSDGF